MQTTRGDIIDLAFAGHFDVIVHGANCFGVMGAGLAKQVRERCPAAYRADLATPKGAASKLGEISHAVCGEPGRPFDVVNAYTQYRYGRGVQVDYAAVRRCFARVRTVFGGRRIAYPRIGAGLAGGDWPTIAGVIAEELAGERHTLVEYAPARY